MNPYLPLVQYTVHTAGIGTVSMYQCLVARYVWYGLAWIHHQYDRYVSKYSTVGTLSLFRVLVSVIQMKPSANSQLTGWIPVVVHPRCFHCSGTSKQECGREKIKEREKKKKRKEKKRIFYLIFNFFFFSFSK